MAYFPNVKPLWKREPSFSAVYPRVFEIPQVKHLIFPISVWPFPGVASPVQAIALFPSIVYRETSLCSFCAASSLISRLISFRRLSLTAEFSSSSFSEASSCRSSSIRSDESLTVALPKPVHLMPVSCFKLESKRRITAVSEGCPSRGAETVNFFNLPDRR
jgi:hypothetical protein